MHLMELVICSRLPSFAPSLCLSLLAVNVDKVDELIKSITAGAEAEKDTAIQRTGSEKKSHRGTGEQLTDGQRVVMG